MKHWFSQDSAAPPTTAREMLERAITHRNEWDISSRRHISVIPIDSKKEYLLRSTLLNSRNNRNDLLDVLGRTTHLVAPEAAFIGPNVGQTLLTLPPSSARLLSKWESRPGDVQHKLFEIIPRLKGQTLDQFRGSVAFKEDRTEDYSCNENRRMLMRELLAHPEKLYKLYREAAMIGLEKHASTWPDRGIQNIMVGPDLSLSHIDIVSPEMPYLKGTLGNWLAESRNAERTGSLYYLDDTNNCMGLLRLAGKLTSDEQRLDRDYYDLTDRIYEKVKAEIPTLQAERNERAQGFRHVRRMMPFTTSALPDGMYDNKRMAFTNSHSVQVVALDDPPKALVAALDRMSNNLITR